MIQVQAANIHHGIVSCYRDDWRQATGLNVRPSMSPLVSLSLDSTSTRLQLDGHLIEQA